MKTGLIRVLIFLVLAVASMANATVSYQDAVESACGEQYDCLVCHTDANGGKNFLTSTGREFRRSGYDTGYFCSATPPPAELSRDVIVIANNDLGMHCLTSGIEYFMVLPPANTLRAQVIERFADGRPKILSDHTDIRVEYRLIENTDESLKADPHFQTWIDVAPKLGFLPAVRADGRVQGIKGATLDGEMHPEPDGWWEIKALPAFPDVSTNSRPEQKIMIDPLGGPSRNPYLSAEVSVVEQATNVTLAATIITVPVAYGGCLECHFEVAKKYGYPQPTPFDSFQVIGKLHERDSGINFATLDPDGDGEAGPVRCSVCHMDPLFGTTPGYPGLPISKFTFSDVLHRWHVQSPVVAEMNPDIATDCYACHPGDDTECYRGVHREFQVWCVNCHGDLNQRVAEGQTLNPWSENTLPTCSQCHEKIRTEGNGHLGLGVFGSFLNSRDHAQNGILCSTCHGAPHALYSSALPLDNQPVIKLQGSAGPIFDCAVCHLAGNKRLRSIH